MAKAHWASRCIEDGYFHRSTRAKVFELKLDQRGRNAENIRRFRLTQKSNLIFLSPVPHDHSTKFKNKTLHMRVAARAVKPTEVVSATPNLPAMKKVRTTFTFENYINLPRKCVACLHFFICT